MKIPLFLTSIRRATLAVALALCSALVSPAQSVATGIVEGRVLNLRNGEYVERARITVEGTSLETFTDSSGQYRLTNVPAGAARVRVFFTGLDVQTDSVVVTGGASTEATRARLGSIPAPCLDKPLDRRGGSRSTPSGSRRRRDLARWSAASGG
jgi:hypothetical protein